MMQTEVGCIDLFCGAGGLTCGLGRAGIPVLAGADLDVACRHPFEANNPARFIQKDVTAVSSEEISTIFGRSEIRVLAGCAPCQPFSTYSQRYETKGTPRWGLLYQFGRLVREIRPEIVTMENVSTLSRHSVHDDFITILKKNDYHLFEEVIDCSAHGLPQTRRRTVLMASLLGPIELETPGEAVLQTVRMAIDDLPPLVAGGTDGHDPLHTSSILSELNLERIRASKPGGTWRDWPEHLVAECHRKSSGKTYPSVYGRMSWDLPSPTLTTQFYGFGNGRFGHPEQDRAISLREGAILQGFPKSYSFLPKDGAVQFRTLGRLIGNAVPVTLGEVIGRSIVTHLGFRAEKMKTKNGGAAADDAREPLVA